MFLYCGERGVPVLLLVRLQESDNALLAPFGFLALFVCVHGLTGDNWQTTFSNDYGSLATVEVAAEVS